MKKIISLIEDILTEAFCALGYDAKFAQAGLSNRPDLCQYQCNGALAAAKLYKKPPMQIANEVAETIEGNSMFAEVKAIMPGFINITLKPSCVASYLKAMAEDERLGLSEAEQKETIVIDYGGANVAKPLHIGHLRSAIIGESVKRLKRHMGHKVISDVHLGDWGLPMGLIIAQLADDEPKLSYFDENYTGEYPKEAPFTMEELERIYPFASARAKEDEGFRKRAQEITCQLQKGKPSVRALWKHIMNVSKEDLKKNYDNLNTEFDLWKGESDADPYIEELLEDLLARGIAYESQGALVVDVTKEGDTKEFPPCIIRKSDGAANYATSDVATIVEREKFYAPDAYIYLTDKRQELHFEQVFRTVRRAGIVKEDTRLKFIGFGTMNGKDGKPFKTRDGGVLRLEVLIKSVEDAVYERIAANRTMEEKEARAIAKKVGLAALKYGDLSNQASKDYAFDIDRFASFEGDTGPYILYTMVRIKSILSKYQEMKDSTKADSLAFDDCEGLGVGEADLMLAVSRFNDVLEHAALEDAPHKVCQYIFELANLFNSFYHENKILTEENKGRQLRWIALISLILRVLTVCIDLLGFEAPDKM